MGWLTKEGDEGITVADIRIMDNHGDYVVQVEINGQDLKDTEILKEAAKILQREVLRRESKRW